MSASEHSMMEQLIRIENSSASERQARLKAGKRGRVRWEAIDEDYELWFKTADYAFDHPPDREVTGYKIIEVRKGKHTKPYALDYELEPGQTRNHPYGITKAGAGSGPPSGPTIIGEG